MKKFIIIPSAIITLALAFAIGFIHPSTVEAADARNFNAGRIIDDGVFTNSDSMTAANIQSFLNSKVPNCDTYGTKTSELGGGTRAQWLASRGISTPITCLKDYYENPSTGENNYGKAIPEGALSAAQIIYTYARQFNINPQVIIVTLQKENGLVTDEWPTPKQFSQAMGFGCPDNVAPGAPACNPAYKNFSTQVYQAARHYRGYLNNSLGWWLPYTTGNNTIRWSPDASCGGSVVYVENRSTAALYNYTPYQPNTAAKNAQWGTGDACSAYGNRNFYMYFTDWFGSTYGGDPVSLDLKIISPITTDPSQPIPGQVTKVSYTVKNVSSQAITYDYSVLQCRLNTTTSCDPAYGPSVTIAAGQTRTFTQDITLPQGGNYTFTPFFFKGGLWSRFGTQDTGINSLAVNAPDMRITTPIVVTSTNQLASGEFRASYTIKNFGSTNVTLQTSVLQCRYNTTINCDSGYGGGITIPPGGSLPVDYYFTPSGGGNHILIPYFMENNVWYRYNAIGGASPNSLTLNVPDVRFTSPLTSSITDPIPGQTTTVSYTVKNFGAESITFGNSLLQCRFNAAENCDTPQSSPITLSAGEERTFSHTISISRAGNYKLIPYYFTGTSWYRYTQGASPNEQLTFSVQKYSADLRLTSEITSSPTTIVPGQTATISYTVKNFGSKPAIYQNGVLQCRLNGAVNCDSGYSGTLTIEPGASRTFTQSVYFSSAGTYTLKPYFLQNDVWSLYGPDQSSSWKNIVVANYIADMRLTTPITISPTNPSPGQTITVSYSVKNFGSLPAVYQDSVLQCRRNGTVNCDSSYSGALTIQPGETKSYSQTVQLTTSGTYTLVPFFLQNYTWQRYQNGSAPANQLVIGL